jgi:hypothetical protein
MTATTWTDRPNLSDIEHFWTAPIAERSSAFAALREREPVPFFPEPVFGLLPPGAGYWALTRLDDIVEASRTPTVFTSGAGSTNIADMPPEFLEFFGSMINLDDPRHSRLRRIVSRGFTPRRLAALTEEVQRTATQIVDEALDMGECDAVRSIAARLPLKIVCDMMGVPASQYDFVGTDMVGPAWYAAALGLLFTAAVVARRYRDSDLHFGPETWWLAAIPGSGLRRLDRTARGLLWASLVAAALWLASLDSPIAPLFQTVNGMQDLPDPLPTRAPTWILLGIAVLLAALSVVDTIRFRRRLLS